jgi:signal recognition particle subunit SRP54
MKMIPGMPKISEEDQIKSEAQLKKTKAIIYSMTPYERKHPEVIKNSRKVRIAKGCGMTNYDVNRVLNQFEKMKEVMKNFKGQYGKFGNLMK